VGNVQFAFAFQQLVDLSYLWTTSTHLNVTNATLANGLVPTDELRVLNDTRTQVHGYPRAGNSQLCADRLSGSLPADPTVFCRRARQTLFPDPAVGY